MYKIELNQTISQIIRLFFKIGVWRSVEESAIRKTGWKLFYLISFILFVIVIAICAIISDDKTESRFLTNVAIYLAVITLKLMYILWKNEETLAFLYAHTVIHSIEDKDESEKINKKMNFFMKFCRTFVCMTVFASILTTIAALPIFSIEKKLPLFISFNLNLEYSEFIYWPAYIFVVFGLAEALLINLNSILLWYIMLVNATEYQVLGNKFRKLGVDRTTKRQLHKKLGMDRTTKRQQQKISKSSPPRSFSQDLIGLIKAHREIYEYNLFKCYSCNVN